MSTPGGMQSVTVLEKAGIYQLILTVNQSVKAKIKSLGNPDSWKLKLERSKPHKAVSVWF